MSLSTPFPERFGVEHPVAQAPVGSVTRPELAAAVSAAGGLGSLAVTRRDREGYRAAIRRRTSSASTPPTRSRSRWSGERRRAGVDAIVAQGWGAGGTEAATDRLDGLRGGQGPLSLRPRTSV